MKKLLIASALVAASTGAFAQANAFDGFSAGVKVSTVGASTGFSDNTGFSANLGQQSFVPTVEAGYTYGLSKEIALGLTATYDVTETKAGSVAGLNIKGENHYSINFKPGYVFNNNTMVYAIVGYNGMTGKVQYGGYSETQTFNGVGAGAGIQVLLNKNVYLQAEAQQITYSGQSKGGLKATPSASVGTIGVGYKF